MSTYYLQPLNPDPTSPWKRYFEDNEILHQIDNDTRYDTLLLSTSSSLCCINLLRRLYPDMSFFQLPTPYPRANFSASTTIKSQST